VALNDSLVYVSLSPFRAARSQNSRAYTESSMQIRSDARSKLRTTGIVRSIDLSTTSGTTHRRNDPPFPLLATAAWITRANIC
jgi:hypothetical protein